MQDYWSYQLLARLLWDKHFKYQLVFYVTTVVCKSSINSWSSAGLTLHLVAPIQFMLTYLPVYLSWLMNRCWKVCIVKICCSGHMCIYSTCLFQPTNSHGNNWDFVRDRFSLICIQLRRPDIVFIFVLFYFTKGSYFWFTSSAWGT